MSVQATILTYHRMKYICEGEGLQQYLTERHLSPLSGIVSTPVEQTVRWKWVGERRSILVLGE
jgi:hypothetical protein